MKVPLNFLGKGSPGANMVTGPGRVVPHSIRCRNIQRPCAGISLVITLRIAVGLILTFGAIFTPNGFAVASLLMAPLLAWNHKNDWVRDTRSEERRVRKEG